MIFLTLLVVWVLGTVGWTYIARESEILNRPRIAAVRRWPGLAALLGCGYCTSFWTGAATFAALLPGLAWPWWCWCYLPLAGICGTGVYWFGMQFSVASAATKLSRPLVELLQVLRGGDGSGDSHVR